MLSGICFGSLARWVLTTGFNPACRVRASASAPSCRFQKVCAPWVTGEDGRLFWWMLNSTAPGSSFTRATRLWRSETFFSRRVALPGS